MESGISDTELNGLLNDILDIYGYDFTAYTKASLKRRIDRLYGLDKFPSYAEFLYRIRKDEQYMGRFVQELTVNVTEMFRDPQFFRSLRDDVFPILATYPYIRIWHAGCSTGEEVYSMAIMLKEAGLLHKSLLYATDLNPKVVKIADSAILPSKAMQQNSENYIKAGGLSELSQYYTSNYGHVMFNAELRKRMVFSTHNLVADSSFNQFQLILCRNVLIYFERELQGKVFALFDESLDNLGFLALGSKETLKLSPVVGAYQQFGKEKIWRKK